MTIADALREAAARLEAVSDTARLDAELLMAEAVGVSRSDLLLRRLGDAAPEGFEALIARRLEHEPVAQILGRKEFYGLDLLVTPDVLIPRADSETLIEAARGALAGRPPKRILDIGTGSGALLLAALTVWPRAEGIGVDRSNQALLVAMRNAQHHVNTSIARIGRGPVEISPTNVDRGFARLVQRDWNEPGWSDDLGLFDLILCNPPYVEEAADLAPSVRDYEPHEALFAGREGLDAYRVLIPQLSALLAPQGAAVFEIGPTQADAVAQIADAAGFSSELRRDLANRPRALILRIRLGNGPRSG